MSGGNEGGPFKRRHERNEKDIKKEREERHHGREALHFRTKEKKWEGGEVRKTTTERIAKGREERGRGGGGIR